MAQDQIEIHERIATIEAELKHVDSELEEMHEEGKERTAQIHAINSKLDTLNTELARYRGAVGGVLLIATAVVGFFKLFWGDLVNWITGNR